MKYSKSVTTLAAVSIVSLISPVYACETSVKVHEDETFSVIKNGKTYRVNAHDIHASLRNVPSDKLKKAVAANLITLKPTQYNDGSWSVAPIVHGKGGGNIAGWVGYGLTKAFGWGIVASAAKHTAEKYTPVVEKYAPNPEVAVPVYKKAIEVADSKLRMDYAGKECAHQAGKVSEKIEESGFGQTAVHITAATYFSQGSVSEPIEKCATRVRTFLNNVPWLP